MVVVPILTLLHLKNDKSHTRYAGKLNNDNFIMNIKEEKNSLQIADRMNIPTKFCSNKPSGFREKDSNVQVNRHFTEIILN